MASTEIVDLIIQTASEAFIYMLPIVGVFAGINYITNFLFYATFTQINKVFK